MKKIVIISSLMLSLFAFANEEGVMESHGNPEDEVKCFKEIRSLGCGKPESHDTFIACVDSKLNKLSPACQVFHKDEVERMKAHSHDH
jgi:hypothetical protein